MEGYLTGATRAPSAAIDVKEGDKVVTKINPAYEEWVVVEQQVFGCLLASVSKDILTQVVNLETAAATWRVITTMLSSQSRARALNTRLALSMTRKGDLSVTEYIGKMKTLADEMSSAGKPLDDEEMMSYILPGLDDDYEPVAEIYTQLLSFESRAKLRQQANGSSVNSARRGGKGGGGGFSNNVNTGNTGAFRGRGGGRGDRGGRGRGNGGGARFSNKPRSTCQLCGKIGHVVADCWYRYDENFIPDSKTAAAASYGVDTNWYMDTGATDHITGELDKLTTHEKYNGKEQIHTASGAGMDIKHVGHSIIHTPIRNIQLKNILHVPKAEKNLISAHRLAVDNHAFVEVHPRFFAIKDQVTKNLLLRGPCRNGLYPLPTSSLATSKQVLGAIKPTMSRWHSRLGHPSLAIVQKVVSSNNLPCLGDVNESGV